MKQLNQDVNLLFLLYLILWPRARVNHGPVAESSSYSPGTSYMHLIGRQKHASRTNDSVLVTRGG